MSNVKIISSEGKEIALPISVLDDLKSKLLGNVLQVGEAGYEEARALWNGMIDKRPALIVRCLGSADVITCVKFARENKISICVKSGGHNIAGTASSNGALMIDLSRMNSVRVDPKSKMVWASAGATLRAIDHETQAFGLATPLGINSTTGIAGLTLGGGFGWTSRSLGLTIDNLISADVVTADGRLLRASKKENPDLFWGICGGGGNFGIVTSFQFKLHPVGPMVLGGLIVHPFTDARSAFRYYRDFVSKVSDKLSCWVVLRKAPPLPFLPPEVHGKEIFIIAALYNGDIKKGEKEIAPLRKFGKPIADIIGPMPFVAFQQMFDPLLTPGARNYWKSHNFAKLSDEALDTIVDYAGKLPTPLTEIFIGQLGGAINRVKKNATAYPHRDTNFVMNVHTRWEDKALDNSSIQWARDFFEVTAKYSNGGVYVNFISEGEQRTTSAFGANIKKLAKLKKKYDPKNFFKANQNISPG